MEQKKKKKKKKLGKNEDEVKQQKRPHKSVADPSSFKPSSEVKGIRFGDQLVVKNFTVRRAAYPELLPLLSISSSPSNQSNPAPFPSTIPFLPTNFTILAHHAWNALTLGLGTKKSKILIFVFATEAMKSGIDRIWPSAIPLGEVYKRLIRGLAGCEMARFKFRKGSITLYVYAVRQIGVASFPGVGDLGVSDCTQRFLGSHCHASISKPKEHRMFTSFSDSSLKEIPHLISTFIASSADL